MKETITVFTGEVKTSGPEADLKSSPIGSCVAVVLFHKNIRFGGMAHIMLPGKAPERKSADSTKYAHNAIDVLLSEMSAAGISSDSPHAVIAGGGNVLKRENDTIGTDNIDSVTGILETKMIKIAASSLKGTERRCVRFDIENGIIWVAKGDEQERELFRIMYETTPTNEPYGK